MALNSSVKKKRVLVFLPILNLGGAEKQGLYCARSLQLSGKYEVEVWALSTGSGTLIPALEEAGLKYRDTGIGFDVFRDRWLRLGAYFRIWAMLLSGRFDAIVPFTYHCNVVSATLFRFAGIRACLWFQIAMEYHLPLSLWEKIAKAMKPIYAANSRAAGGFIAEKHGFDATTVAFIPNPFEPIRAKKNKAEWLAVLGLAPADELMVMAANYFPEKEHATLIKAMPALLKSHPNLKLGFAGALMPEHKVNALKALAFDLNLIGKVVFIGSTDDISGLLEASAVGILSSRSEGSPNALIEYMGYGLPAIATSIPAIIELLGADYPYLIEVENVEDFRSKVELLLSSLDYNQGVISRNRSVVAETYSVENNFKAFDTLLSNAIND